MTEQLHSSRRPVWPWIAGIVVALAIGAAGGWTAATAAQDEAPAPAAAAPPVPSASAVPPSSPEPSASVPAKAGVLKLGQAHTFTTPDGYTVAVTALTHQRKEDHEGVQVRTCNRGKSAFNASTVPWLLSYDGGEQLVDITSTGGGLLSPPFVERELVGGKCVKGWISFERPSSGSPDGVEYRIDEVTSARWEW